MNNKYDQTHASLNVCTYVQCSIHIFKRVYTQVHKNMRAYSYIHLCTMHMLAYLNIYSFLYMSFNCFFFFSSYSYNLQKNVLWIKN